MARRTSIQRRVDFSERWNLHIDTALKRFGARRSPAFNKLFAFGNVAFDVVDSLRERRWPQDIGRAYLTAISGRERLRQNPDYRGYWFDEDRNALVGLHIGADLNYFDGRFYLIENNINPAMQADRRQLYSEKIDPVLKGLAELALRRGFREVFLYSRVWTSGQLTEIALASKAYGIPISPLQTPSSFERVTSIPQVVQMPDPLPRNSLHVLFSVVFMTPLMHFVHDKGLVQDWYSRQVDKADGLLASVDWSHNVFVPPDYGDIWPNLVVKLAEIDRGKAVVMGRFDTEDEIREAIGLPEGSTGIPAVFKDTIKWGMPSLFRRPLRVLFQGFVPGDVIDGRLISIRMHSFVSPVEDVMLSAHCRLAGQPLQEKLENGLIAAHDAYVIKGATALRWARLGEDMESKLSQVAVEFGGLLKNAVSEVFDTCPDDRRDCDKN